MRLIFLLAVFFPILSLAQRLEPTMTPRFQRVIWIVFENESLSSTISNAYFKSLADQGIQFTQMMAETHPSQGNYIAMIAGDLLGVGGDGVVNLNATHLGDLLEQKGLDWKVYAEDYPGNCFLGSSSGKYVRKHVPFLNFVNVQSNPERCAKIVNFSDFQSDWSHHRLPAYSMVVPNMDNDGHDTDIDFAAQWFEKTFSASLKDPRLMQDTLFVVTFDESGNYFAANKIYTVLLSPNLPQKISIKDKHNHYSLLKFIEDEWQLGHLGRMDMKAPVIQELKAQ